MAFTQETFATVGAHSANTPNVYSYKSDDALADIRAASYFEDKRFQLEEGDTIFVCASDGYDILVVQVDRETAIKAPYIVTANKTEVINEKSDFPEPSGGVITCVADTNYWIGDFVNIGTDRFDVSAGNISFSSNNPFAPLLTYEGTEAMFTGTQANFDASRINLKAPNGSVFNFSDPTTPGTSIINISSVQVLECASYGVFDDIQTLTLSNSNMLNATDGMTISGANITILSAREFGMLTSSASFVGINLSDSVSLNIEFRDLVGSGPAGSVGVSGTDSDNIATGQLGAIRDSNFVGGMTSISGFSRDDCRWLLSGIPGLQDTKPDAEADLQDNALETVISVADTPVKLNATTWEDSGTSQFTVSADGRVTYSCERPLTAPIDAQVGLLTSAGLTDGYIAIAVNGTVVKSGVVASLNNVKPVALSVFTQVTFNQNDYVEVFVADKDGTTNLIGQSGTLRVN